MASQKSTPMSTPVRLKKTFVTSKSTDKTCSDENEKPSGTPLSHFKNHVKATTNTSPKTPLSSHNKLNKSPQSKTNMKPTTPKSVTHGQQLKTALFKTKNSSGSNATPKRPTPSSRSSTPKTAKSFKTPASRCITPVKVENSVLVQFSQDIFSSATNEFSTPSKPTSSLNDGSHDPFGMMDKLNRSHSASSLFRLRGKDEETPLSKIKRSLSEAKLSLNSSLEGEGESSRLTVGVRVRPLLPREGMNSIQVCNGEIKVASDLGSEHNFKYDHVFSSTSSQEEVYEALVRPLLDNAFQGYNACLFAYGQTGSGKTYSMMGPFTEGSEGSVTTESGMIPRFCQELLEKTLAVEEACPSVTTTVEVSYLEVYNEKIHDLLVPGNSQLRVREHPVYGPHVVDLSRHSVNSFEEFQHWIEVGNKKRAVAATELNDKSSRSHSLFTVILTQTFAQVRSDGTWSHDQTRRSQINLVDLAGSERIANSAVSSDRLREGVSINRSLLTLGKVMSALVEKRGFVPYRESVLTWLLKESLGGNSRTCMLATVSPCSNHMDETLSTLRYASQARSIVNRVRVNEAPQDREIRQLREELERLRGAGERINNLLSENEDLREQLKFTEEQCKTLEENLSKCTMDLTKAEETNNCIKNVSNISQEEELKKCFKEQVSKLESEINGLKAELIEVKDANVKLKKELEQSKRKELNSLHDTEQILNLQAEVKHLKSELYKNKSDLTDALSSNDSLKQEIVEKEIAFTSVQEDLTSGKQRIADLEKEMRTLKKDIKKSESLLAESKENIEVLQRKLNDAVLKEEEMKNELEQIPGLELVVQDLESELRKSRAELFESRKCQEKLKKQLESGCIEKLQIELQQCKDELEKANETILNEQQKLAEVSEREGLLKIKLEKIPALESELKLVEAEARKAKRELAEYLSDREEMIEDLTENGHNDTVYELNTSSDNDSELNKLQEELDICKKKLKESEEMRQDLIKELTESRSKQEHFLNKLQEYADLEIETNNCKIELIQSKERELELKKKVAESNIVEERHKIQLERFRNLETEVSGLKDQLENEKKTRDKLEKKISESTITIERMKSKADQAIHFEIELAKCKEELHKLQSTHMNCTLELMESQSREDVIKTEIAAKNQQVEDLRFQLKQSQETQAKLMEEKLALLKVMEKTCSEKDTKTASTRTVEENIGLKKDLATLKEKLSERDKVVLEKERRIKEVESLLRAIVQYEKRQEKAISDAMKLCDKDVYKHIMDTAFPHHLVYLVRKARTFSETYKVPYEFVLNDNCVTVRHLMLSAKAVLSHLQLSKWIERIEAENTWYKLMDRDIPWEVDFGDYYEKNNVHKIVLEDSTKVDSAINCGIVKTAAGCINPIIWRKTMVKRHVMGIKEDSDVLIQYFNEIEDSRIYSILSRIQVSVSRLQEATQNVEK